MFASLARAVLARRGRIAVLLVLLAGLLLSGLASLRAEFTLTTFFGSDDPERQFLYEYKARWGPDDTIVVVVVGVDVGSLLEPERLAALEALRLELAACPAVREASGLTSLPRLRGPPGTITLDPIQHTLPAAGPGEPALEEWAAAVLADPILVPTVLSASGRWTALLVRLETDEDDVQQIIPLVRELRTVLDAHQGRAGLSLTDAGVPAVRTDFFSALTRDQRLFVGLGLLFITLSLLAIFRRLHGLTVPDPGGGRCRRRWCTA